VIDGKRGFPVYFRRSRVGPLLCPRTGDEGGRRCLAQHENQVEPIPANDPGVSHDLDRPGAVLEEVSRHGSRVQ